METLKIVYHDPELIRIEKKEKGDWIDLRASEDMAIKAGELAKIPLGVSIQLPDGYEAIVAPRSSTCKNFGIIMPSSIGIIDESFCGDTDIWSFPAYAIRDTTIKKNDRICQFRIVKHQPELNFEVVDKLNNPDRGGYGSSGKN